MSDVVNETGYVPPGVKAKGVNVIATEFPIYTYETKVGSKVVGLTDEGFPWSSTKVSVMVSVFGNIIL